MKILLAANPDDPDIKRFIQKLERKNGPIIWPEERTGFTMTEYAIVYIQENPDADLIIMEIPPLGDANISNLKTQLKRLKKATKLFIEQNLTEARENFSQTFEIDDVISYSEFEEYLDEGGYI